MIRKNAVVTGCSYGLGAEICRKLIDDGYYYTFSTEGTTLTIRRLTCEDETINLKVNIGIILTFSIEKSL